MRRKGWTLAAAAVAALLPGCWRGPAVVQGTVVSFDRESKVVVVLDERGGARSAFDVSGAEIGAEPAEGDRVRLAYREEEGKRVASRLMNLTRQAEIGKGSGH